MDMLDLTILRQQDGTLQFDVYRKATHTNQYINWDSDQPLAHKGSTIRSLTRRAHLIPTGPVRQAAELKRVHQALHLNGYPSWAIKRYSHPIPPPPPPHPPTNPTTPQPTHQTPPHHHNSPHQTQDHSLPPIPPRNIRDHQQGLPQGQCWRHHEQQELAPHPTRPPQGPDPPHPQIIGGLPHPLRR